MGKCLEKGIYFILDYHTEAGWEDFRGTTDTTKIRDGKNEILIGTKFMVDVAKNYGKYPNALFEPFNEPKDDATAEKLWNGYFKPVIGKIRKYAPDNIIILGSPGWSASPDSVCALVISDAILGQNIAVTLHFYAASHSPSASDNFRNAEKAISWGCAVFATEWGACDAVGDGVLDENAAYQWHTFLDENSISSAAWSVSTKDESCSMLQPSLEPVNLPQTGMYSVANVLEKVRVFSNGQSAILTPAGDIYKKIINNHSMYKAR